MFKHVPLFCAIKSKSEVCKELKQEIGLVEYLEYVKEHLLDYFQSFIQVPMGCLRSWVGMIKGVGHMSVLIVGLVKSRLNMFFLSVHHMIPRD